ncbi:nucleotidyltransferase [Halobacillus fulvus]|nr:nucleotidyltransferase [Halobacillus fulvus]
MKACGVIVEYNPFHNGHRYHLQKAREASKADCIIAIMSGSFLQRGEPAIIDKWHRAEAALNNGADLILELPYLYAVEHSDHFSHGAVSALSEMNAEAICFGSEHGSIEAFLEAYNHMQENKATFDETVQQHLKKGLSFPEASRLGYDAIQLPDNSIDLSQPNNILGYSYVKAIQSYNPTITPLTIQRSQSQYHDPVIEGAIASATSIRNEIKQSGSLTDSVQQALPKETVEKLEQYKAKTGVWHEWEQYFDLLDYKIMTSTEHELRLIHGVDEGLEYRLKRMMKHSTSFESFMKALKTKRYTWTRLQRTLVHILTGLKKEEAQTLLREDKPGYVRVLGMNETGRFYLNEQKKKIDVPLVTQPQKFQHPMLALEEKASISYYSILGRDERKERIQREYGPPVIV